MGRLPQHMGWTLSLGPEESLKGRLFVALCTLEHSRRGVTDQTACFAENWR